MAVSSVSSSDASTTSTKTTGAGNKGFLKSFLANVEAKYAMQTKGFDILQQLREMFPDELFQQNNTYIG